MPRTLVTGLAGFTGQHVHRVLVRSGHTVIGLGHAGAVSPSDIEYYAADLIDEATLRLAVHDARADYVIHLAAIAAVDHGQIGQLYETNVLGTRNLLAALADAPVRPRSVIVASSANVYGNAYEGKLAEHLAPQPANDYGVSKVAAENLAHIFDDRLPIIVTRPFNYTGVGQAETFLIPKIVGHALRGERQLRLGNIHVSRDFSDVRMVAEVYARLLENPTAVGRTVNICSERATTLQDIIAMVESLAGFTFDVEIDPRFVRANDVKTLFGDGAQLRTLVGDLPVPSLGDTLSWMLGR